MVVAKVGDIVERKDFTRMFGRILSVKGMYARVRYVDRKTPKIVTEKIGNLALVARR